MSNSLEDAGYVITHWAIGITSPILYLKQGFIGFGLEKNDLVFLMPSLLLLASYDYLSLKMDVIAAVSSKKIVLRWMIYLFFVLWMIVNVPVANSTEFIYFQF